MFFEVNLVSSGIRGKEALMISGKSVEHVSKPSLGRCLQSTSRSSVMQ